MFYFYRTIPLRIRRAVALALILAVSAAEVSAASQFMATGSDADASQLAGLSTLSADYATSFPVLCRESSGKLRANQVSGSQRTLFQEQTGICPESSLSTAAVGGEYIGPRHFLCDQARHECAGVFLS